MNPPEKPKPLTRRTGIKQPDTLGEWQRDHDYPAFPVRGGVRCHGVRVDSDGRAWGSYRVVKEGK